MLFKLFLLFSLIPVIELTLLLKVGSLIGTVNTVVIVIATALVGASLVNHEGIGVFYRMQQDLSQGLFPAEELINGVMILLAGALLLTPGFLTDLLGFLLVFPPTRGAIKKLLKRSIERHMDIRRF